MSARAKTFRAFSAMQSASAAPALSGDTFPTYPPEEVTAARGSEPGRRGGQAGGIANLRVLVSDEHYKHSLGIVRQLGRLGAHVEVLAASRNSLACRSRYCRGVVHAGARTVEAMVAAILNVVRNGRFDLVIPVSSAMTRALAKRRAEILPFAQMELADSAAIEMASDKFAVTQLAERLGVPVPRTTPASHALRYADELRFPVVVKPRTEAPGRAPVRYAQSPGELRDILLASRTSNSLTAAADFLIQEFIPGFGCGFFATYQRGTCRRAFMHRRVREYPASGGVSSCAESFHDPKLERYGRQILDALKWHGVAMVEFRRDSRDGDYKLIEVNPKFWGSLDLALAAGADFPGDLCRMALGQELAFTDDYRRRLRFHWPLSGHGELFHIWTRPASLFAVAGDLLNPFVKSNVAFDDPLPNLLELRGVASQLRRFARG